MSSPFRGEFVVRLELPNVEDERVVPHFSDQKMARGGLKQVMAILVTMQQRQEGDPKQAVAMQVTIQSMQALLPDEKAGFRLVNYVSSREVFVVQAEPRVPPFLLLCPNSYSFAQRGSHAPQPSLPRRNRGFASFRLHENLWRR